MINLFTPEFFFTVIRVTTPILFAAMAAIICTKSGVINIALESIMLTAALTGVLASGYSQSLFVGMIGGILGGMLIAGMLAYFSLYLKADIILVGIALNLMAVGGTVFVMFATTGDRGATNSIRSLQFPSFNIPIIQDIPILGQVLSGHNILTYLAILSVFGVWFFLGKTTFGLRMRSVGENPDAATSVGIDVRKVKLIAILISGALGGFGGMYMSMAYLSVFSTNMVAGRGFISLAAASMGQANPFGTLIAATFFGLMESVSYQLQALGIPAQIVDMVPYISVIIGLVVYAQYQQNLQNRKKLLRQLKEESNEA
jgi:simple sugar transport system permease protein